MRMGIGLIYDINVKCVPFKKHRSYYQTNTMSICPFTNKNDSELYIFKGLR